MSVKYMTWAWTQSIPNSARKLVLLALADRANDDGECWPGITSLSEKCSIPRRTLIRAIQDLQSDGFITAVHRQGNGNGRATNLYRLNLDRPADQAKCQSDTRQSANLTLGKVPNLAKAKCQSDTRQSAKSGGAKCQSLAPNTSVDTSEREEEKAQSENRRSVALPETAEKTSSPSRKFLIEHPAAIIGAWSETNPDRSSPALTPQRQKRIAETLDFLKQQIGRPDWPISPGDIRPWFTELFGYARSHTSYLSQRDFDFFLDADRLARVVEGCYEPRH